MPLEPDYCFLCFIFLTCFFGLLILFYVLCSNITTGIFANSVTHLY